MASRRGGIAAAAVVALSLAAFGLVQPAHALADADGAAAVAVKPQEEQQAADAVGVGRRGLRGCCHKPPSPPPSYWYSPPPSPPPSWYSPPPSPPPSWYSPPSNSPWPYYSPPYYSWNNFPYTRDCYFDSTGVYKIKRKSTYPAGHDYTRYCFWIQAKQPDYNSHKQCRNFDLWSINFRVHHDCENQVSDLTFNGQPLSPVWAQNLPSDKSMLQITRGGNQYLDSQSDIAYHKAEVCFTLPNWCPLDKFCKDKRNCKVAFYPSPYDHLQCCPSWECSSQSA